MKLIHYVGNFIIGWMRIDIHKEIGITIMAKMCLYPRTKSPGTHCITLYLLLCHHLFTKWHRLMRFITILAIMLIFTSDLLMVIWNCKVQFLYNIIVFLLLHTLVKAAIGLLWNIWVNWSTVEKYLNKKTEAFLHVQTYKCTSNLPRYPELMTLLKKRYCYPIHTTGYSKRLEGIFVCLNMLLKIMYLLLSSQQVKKRHQTTWQ